MNNARENLKHGEDSYESLDENSRSFVNSFKLDNSDSNRMWINHLKEDFFKLLPEMSIWLIKLCHDKSGSMKFSYYPITECQELFIELVFLFKCLPGSFKVKPYSNGIMIMCELSDKDGADNRQARVLLTTIDTGLPSIVEGEDIFSDYVGYMITELRLGMPDKDVIHRSYRIIDGNSPESRRPIHVKVIYWKDIFDDFDYVLPENQSKIDKVKQTVWDALLFPSKYQKLAGKSIPQRLKKYRQEG